MPRKKIKTIGVDASALAAINPTGVGKYVESLLKAMQGLEWREDELIKLYVPKGFAPPSWLNNEHFLITPLSWPLFTLWTHLRLGIELKIKPPNLFVSLSHEIPILALVSLPIVATVHDIVFKRTPVAYSAIALRRQEWSIRQVIKKAELIIGVSKATCEAVSEDYEVEKTRLRAIPLSGYIKDELVTSEFDFDSAGIEPGKYWLTVGRVETKKNQGLLIKAFDKWLDGGADCDLVIVGGFGFGGLEIMKIALKCKHKDRIKFFDYLPQSQLEALWSGAIGLAFPTLGEGFGLPVLEAMSRGVPVLASDLPVLREVGGEAVWYALLNEIDQWVRGLEELTNNQAIRANLIAVGKIEAEEFSWEKTARATQAVWREILA